MSGYIGNIPVPQATQTRQSFTATASQTTFNTAGYTAGFIDVFLNGIKLVDGTDYTATNGSDVVLTTGAALDDVLDVVAYTAFDVANNTLTDATINNTLTLKNATEEDTDGGRESTIIFKGEQSGGEISTLAEIEAAHDGTADDEKGDLIFRTNDGADGSAPTERLRIDSAGNVGIGTNDPATPLDVTKAGGANFVATFQNTTSATPYGVHIKDAASGANGYPLLQATNSAGSSAYFLVHSGTGNVGIGTSSPSAKLTVASSGNAGLTLRQNTTADRFKLFVGDGTSGYAADENFISSNNTNLRFLAGGSGTTEVMQLTSSGLVGIGRTPSYHLDVDSTSMSPAARFNRYTDGSQRALVYFRSSSNGNSVGYISINNTSTAYNTSSDYRLKENVTNITDGIARVKQLAAKRFNFIADPDTTVDGFLAHEAAIAVPEAVHGTHNEVDDEGNPVYQGIDQSKLVPLLTAALQEAIAKIETLETEMTSVKSRLDALENPA